MAHAKARDLPGYEAPARVRDIPHHKESWGSIPCFTVQGVAPFGQDELGYLWVNGNIVPKGDMPPENDANPGAVVFHANGGIGIWVHPKSYRHLMSINRTDMIPDNWLTVTEVTNKLPSFITKHFS